jgi:hypothetical protein
MEIKSVLVFGYWRLETGEWDLMPVKTESRFLAATYRESGYSRQRLMEWIIQKIDREET